MFALPPYAPSPIDSVPNRALDMFKKLMATKAPKSVLLVRLAAGGVFLSEGIQKFLFPGELGAGRFAQIHIPSPHFFGPFVGVIEIGCGACLILGLLTRLAAIPLIIDMVVAIYTTKVPIYLKSGFWKMAHEARVDYTMLLCCLFLLTVGAGGFSMDGSRGGKGGGERSSKPAN